MRSCQHHPQVTEGDLSLREASHVPAFLPHPEKGSTRAPAVRSMSFLSPYCLPGTGTGGQRTPQVLGWPLTQEFTDGAKPSAGFVSIISFLP